MCEDRKTCFVIKMNNFGAINLERLLKGFNQYFSNNYSLEVQLQNRIAVKLKEIICWT